jgi:hypothetical protein
MKPERSDRVKLLNEFFQAHQVMMSAPICLDPEEDRHQTLSLQSLQQFPMRVEKFIRHAFQGALTVIE